MLHSQRVLSSIMFDTYGVATVDQTDEEKLLRFPYSGEVTGWLETPGPNALRKDVDLGLSTRQN